MKTKHAIVTEIVINAPAAIVWQILTDFSAYKHWNPFIINAEGTLKKGATLKNTLMNGHSTMTFKPLVLQVIPEKYFDWKGSLFFPGIFDGQHYFEIQPLENNSVKLVHGENFSGIFSSFIFKKIGNDTKNNFIKMNNALKNEAEKHFSQQENPSSKE